MTVSAGSRKKGKPTREACWEAVSRLWGKAGIGRKSKQSMASEQKGHRLWSRMPRQLVFSGPNTRVVEATNERAQENWRRVPLNTWLSTNLYMYEKKPPKTGKRTIRKKQNNLWSFYRDRHILYSHQPELKGLQIPGTSGRILWKVLFYIWG